MSSFDLKVRSMERKNNYNDMIESSKVIIIILTLYIDYASVK